MKDKKLNSGIGFCRGLLKKHLHNGVKETEQLTL